MTAKPKGRFGRTAYPLWRCRPVKILSGLVAVAVIFVLGVEFGNGTISFAAGNGVNSSLPATLDYSSVDQVYQSLKANYDGKLTEPQLLNGLKHGLAEATKDPYTEYFTPAEAQQFNGELNNSFSGIGAELSKNAQGDIEVIAPVAGTPADKAGIKAQDIIATVNGKTTAGMSVDEAVNVIRGKAGTKVRLQIVRGGTQALTFTITRQNIQVPSVNTKLLPNNIGYIQITTFADDTPRLISQAADKMKQAHVKGIVLDLRDNPGGLVDSAVAVSSEWLPGGQVIMQEKTGHTVVQTYYATGGDELHGIPTVVLVDGGSASASEITAGALHDHNQATVMGTKSFGKGVVQQIINFKDGSELKVTIASWYRPDGKNINHLGITPDQVVKEPDNATPDNDPQLQAAENYLNK